MLFRSRRGDGVGGVGCPRDDRHSDDKRQNAEQDGVIACLRKKHRKRQFHAEPYLDETDLKKRTAPYSNALAVGGDQVMRQKAARRAAGRRRGVVRRSRSAAPVRPSPRRGSVGFGAFGGGTENVRTRGKSTMFRSRPVLYWASLPKRTSGSNCWPPRHVCCTAIPCLRKRTW